MNNNKTTIAKELVGVIDQIEQLRQKEKELREKLLRLMNSGETIEVDGYTVVKKMVKETITDTDLLQQIGFDLSRVTVTITKVDPALVRTIGEKEGKKYYVEVEKIIVSKK